MTPAGFDYLQPTSIGEALEMVGLHPDTRFLAGGHALLPDSVLPERHRRHPHPSALVDLGRIAELRGIQILQDAGSPHGGDSSGAGRLVRIGAMTTTADIEYSPDIARAVPLLSQAAAQISDPLIRNRATLGGSLAEADPHGDWPPLVLATDATMQLRSRDGERTVPAAGFFTSDRAGPGTGSTTLWPGELLTAVTVPAFDARTRATYLKRMHPATGHAMLGVAAAVTVDADQTCRGCRIAITGAGGVATRAVRAEAQLVGSRLTPETIQGPRTRQATGSSSSATRSVRRLPGRAATPLPQPSAVPAHHPIHTQLTGARTIARTPARADPGVVRTWTTEPRAPAWLGRTA